MREPSFFQKDRLLSECTTLRVGGPALFFVEAKSVEMLQKTFEYCQKQSLPYFILGRGSNCFFDDRGFEGVVIHNRIDFIEERAPGNFHVGGGYPFSRLGQVTAKKSWSGLEFASGIPGSVGGAVTMNAGANGQETSETLESVDWIDHQGTTHYFKKSELTFGYRHSPFQQKKGIVVGATFQLSPSEKAKEFQVQLIRYRKETQPLSEQSAGCMFRNPTGESAGALIDRLGLKGATIGGAKVSEKHANFMINTGKATSQDIQNLISLIQNQVKEQTEISLEQEVIFVPYHYEPIFSS